VLCTSTVKPLMYSSLVLPACESDLRCIKILTERHHSNLKRYGFKFQSVIFMYSINSLHMGCKQTTATCRERELVL
jgi:hypothetical protein